jgi:transcription antitermination factor NusG
MVAIREAHEGAWVAVQVRAGFERPVSVALQTRGYVEFVPTYTPRYQRAAPRQGWRVLFPGYVFCRYIRFPAFRIVEIPGVVRLVGFGNKVALIPDEEIEDIRKIVASDAATRVIPPIPEGGRIEVVNGPLKGVTGVLSRHKSKDWVVISVSLLSRSVAVEVNRGDVRPLAPEPVEQALSQRRPAARAAESHSSAVAYAAAQHSSRRSQKWIGRQECGGRAAALARCVAAVHGDVR